MASGRLWQLEDPSQAKATTTAETEHAFLLRVANPGTFFRRMVLGAPWELRLPLGIKRTLSTLLIEVSTILDEIKNPQINRNMIF